MATLAASEQKIDIGRILQRCFQTIGRHVLPFAGLALLLAGLPTFLTQTFLIGSLPSDPSDPNAALNNFLSPFYWLSMLITMICGYLLQATLVRASILDLSGRDPDIGGSLSEALKLILPMIGLAILSSIIMGIGFMLLVVPGIIIMLMLIVSVPVLVEERLGVIDSMRRSRELTKGSRGRIFLVLVLLGLAYFVVSAMVGGTMMFLEGGVNIATFSAVGGGLAGSVVGLLGAALLASLYVELRTIKEGATPEGLASIFD